MKPDKRELRSITSVSKRQTDRALRSAVSFRIRPVAPQSWAPSSNPTPAPVCRAEEMHFQSTEVRGSEVQDEGTALKCIFILSSNGKS